MPTTSTHAFTTASSLHSYHPIALAVAAALLLGGGPTLAQMGQGNQGGGGGGTDTIDDVDIDGDEMDDDGDYDFGRDDPFVFRGDGMTVVIADIDPNTGQLSGTITLDGQPAMRFSAQQQFDDQGNSFGRGQVQTQSGAVPIEFRDESDTVVRVQFQGRNYRVALQDDAAPPHPHRRR